MNPRPQDFGWDDTCDRRVGSTSGSSLIPSPIVFRSWKRLVPCWWPSFNLVIVVRALYPQMLLDPHLLIVYPFAGFFYLAPENTELAAAIQTGFEWVIADGSYQRLVEEAIMTPWLWRQLKLRSRRILVLQNT